MWQVRTICTYVAATVPVEKVGDATPLLDSAQQIGLSETAKKEQANKPAEPKPGSYENFMSTFGSPHKWAG